MIRLGVWVLRAAATVPGNDMGPEPPSVLPGACTAPEPLRAPARREHGPIQLCAGRGLFRPTVPGSCMGPNTAPAPPAAAPPAPRPTRRPNSTCPPTHRWLTAAAGGATFGRGIVGRGR